MQPQSSSPHVAGWAFVLPVLVSFLGGLGGGLAVVVLAFLTARYGPSGDSWSFRGNGALAALTVLPALLATGWVADALHYRAKRSWLWLGLGAGLVALLLAAADAALLPIGGTGADRIAGPVLLLGLLAWTLAAPLLAATLGVRERISTPHRLLAHASAASVLPFAIALAFLVGERFLRAGS